MTDEELQRIEHRVNEKIRENIALDERRNVPVQEAMNMGAMALFGEKYGEFVRVITFDPAFSRELCGGTHVSATGQIGLLKSFRKELSQPAFVGSKPLRLVRRNNTWKSNSGNCTLYGRR